MDKDEVTHHRNNRLIWKIASFKDKILRFARGVYRDSELIQAQYRQLL